jgi:hypothetical protein
MNPVQLRFRVLGADRRTRTSTMLTTAGVAVATARVLLLVNPAGLLARRRLLDDPPRTGPSPEWCWPC